MVSLVPSHAWITSAAPSLCSEHQKRSTDMQAHPLLHYWSRKDPSPNLQKGQKPIISCGDHPCWWTPETPHEKERAGGEPRAASLPRGWEGKGRAHGSNYPPLGRNPGPKQCSV